MTEYVGVKGWYDGDISAELKRAALIFDKLIVKHVHSEGVCDKFPHLKADLKYLLDRDVVRTAPSLNYDTKAYPWLSDYDELLLTNPSSVWKFLVLGNLGKPEATRWRETKAQTYLASADAYARVASLILRNDDVTACPLLASPARAHPCLPTRKAEVLRLIYDNLPVPDELTDWSSIIDWRNDPDAKHKFASLRVWINDSARSSWTLSEIRDYLEAAILDYKAYTARRYKSFKPGKVALFGVALIKVIEELPKLKISPFVDAFVDARKLEIEATKEELNSPHREIAYVVASQRRFKDE